MTDVVLTPILPAEPDVLGITYKGVRIVGDVLTMVTEDSLVVSYLAIDTSGIVDKEFLTSLVAALEALAIEKGLSKLKIEYRSQKLTMYGIAGFVQSYEVGEAHLVVKQVVKSNPAPIGTCYEDAWRFLIKQDEGFLIHGSVQLSAEGPRIWHAWVELTTGWVWEPQTGQYFTLEDFQIMSPVEENKYTNEEAAIMVARTDNMGPWSEEERAEYIRR